MAWGDLPFESRTLDPLGRDLRSGLTAVTVLAFASFFASTTLFVYLVYKLTTWYLFVRGQPAADSQEGPLQKTTDFTLGIDGVFSDNNGGPQEAASGLDRGLDRVKASKHPNQFLVLITNLLLADMHQGIAFLLNTEWLRKDAIVVGTPTCFAQGLFVSFGDLASSMFITAIAIHTYLSVVSRRRTPQVRLYVAIAAIWIFIYAMSFIPIAATSNGAEFGGFFVRAGSWCWMNRKYDNLRLFTHYLWIFIGLSTTSILYLIIFLHIRRQARAESTAMSSKNDNGDITSLQLSRNPAFLIYPVIYVLCTLPLAMGRIATMAGAKVPNGYFCFAGAMIASNGLFDCLLFGTTRNVIIFASKYDMDASDVGLNTFAFMKTPANRRFGNIIAIQGGRNRPSSNGGWWSWSGQKSPAETRSRKGIARTVSEESLRGPAIHMDTVTSVVVEHDDKTERDPRFPDPLSSSNPSLNSTDKDYATVMEGVA